MPPVPASGRSSLLTKIVVSAYERESQRFAARGKALDTVNRAGTTGASWYLGGGLTLGDRLMVGRQSLNLAIKVRILVPEPGKD